MDYEVRIEALEELRFIACTQMVSMNDDKDSIGTSIKLWDAKIKDGTIDRLKKERGEQTVYALFCNVYHPEASMISYDFVCKSSKAIINEDFKTIVLRPALYAVFKSNFTKPITREDAYRQMNDAFWGQWLPKTNYTSVIDYDFNPGSASIELWEPIDESPADFKITIWFPIIEKE